MVPGKNQNFLLKAEKQNRPVSFNNVIENEPS